MLLLCPLWDLAEHCTTSKEVSDKILFGGWQGEGRAAGVIPRPEPSHGPRSGPGAPPTDLYPEGLVLEGVG